MSAPPKPKADANTLSPIRSINSSAKSISVIQRRKRVRARG
jgi:hypothetical protein